MNYFNYFTEIEEAFIRRRGKHLLLSPLDWALIEDWKEREIPLRIVIRGIEEVFDTIDKNPRNRRNIKSLSYCKNEIEALYEEWRSSQIGRSAGANNSLNEETSVSSHKQPTLFSEPTIDKHLVNVIAELGKVLAKVSPAMRQTLESVRQKLIEQTDSYKDAERLELELNELEATLDAELLKTSDPAFIKKATKEIESGLAKNKTSIDAKVYRRTLDLMVLKRLREEAGIPRLSLFYL